LSTSGLSRSGETHADPATAGLERINRELARLLDCAPAPLVTGADAAQHDPLVVCGLLGGKDVGKSTLINALAGEEISIDREEAGAGTSRPLVYVHRDMVGVARDRLGRIGRVVPNADLQFFPHQADAIRNVALVDLPDFDSDFRQHETIARTVAPYLDRVIWVITPRKIADRAWVEFARDVVKAAANVYFVLNKGDELLADEEGWAAQAVSQAQAAGQAEQFAHGQRAWACDTLCRAGYEVNEDQLFLIAARYPQSALFVERVAAIWDDPQWRQYGADRQVVTAIAQRFTDELERLRECVLAPVDPELAARIKAENLLAQVRQNVARVREHFELDYWIEQTSRTLTPEYRQSLLNAAFGPEFCRTLAGRLLRSRRSDVELADEVMDVRASRWPVLRVLYWMSRWAIRRLGRAMAGPTTGDIGVGHSTGDDLFRIRARSLADRAGIVIDHLKAEHGPVLRQLRLIDRLPDSTDLAGQVETELAELPARGDEELIGRLTRDYRPGLLGRLMVWAVLLWFPLVQPVTAGLLEMASAGMSVTDWLHGLYRVVVALGAVQLLHGLVVVGLIDLAALAAIYGRCVRQVQADRATLLEPGASATGFLGSGPGPSVQATDLRRLGGASRAADLQQQIDVLGQEIDSMLAGGIIGPVLRPVETAVAELADWSAQLDKIGGNRRSSVPADRRSAEDPSC
jgi:hypothetical protein